MTGPTGLPGVPGPLVETLLSHAARHPQQPALVAGDEIVSYGEFALRIRAAASRIRRVLAGRGDRVALCGPNSPELAVAYFAVHAAGGVAVLLDADATPETARWVVADAEARLTLDSRDLGVTGQVEDLIAWSGPEEEGGKGRRGEGEKGRAVSPSLPLSPSPPPFPSLADPADLIYTTGTTGRKKGVLLTHENIASATCNINAFVGTCGDDREVVPLPLSHSFGLGRLRAMALAGHCLLLLPGMRNPAIVVKQLLDSKATGLALVPAGVDLILRMTRDRLGDAREHLRYVEIGSAGMSLETKRKLVELLPHTRICHHYGLTEASRAAFLEYHADCDHLDSIGRPSPNVSMAVHDGEGRELPDGQEGEIVVRGGMVTRQYWRQPELTRAALRDGWLRTGDLGHRDAQGYYYLTGRDSDLVNIGGLKVSPEEVERALNAHPAVVESACVGVPDPQGIVGECLKGCVVLRGDVRDEELVEWLRARIEEYKIPRIWQRVEKIAKTPSGKIQRHLM